VIELRVYHRSLPALCILVLVALLTACSPQNSPPSHAPGSITPLVKNVPPAQAFGGSCDAILSEAMVAKAVGAAVRLAAAQYSPVTYAVPSLGGIECFWDGDAGRLSLTVLPSGALSHASAQALTCDVGGTSGCAFNTYVDGYWFSGILFTADQSDTTARAAVAALEPQLAISAKAAGAPPRATSVVGAWKKPVSCAALSASAGVPSAAGSPTLETTSVDSASGVEEYQPDGFYAAHKASAWFGCESSTSAVVPAGALSHFVVEFAPGGAWANKLGFPGTTTAVAIPGTDEAFATTDSGGIEQIAVFSGVNWLEFEEGPFTIAQVTPIVHALLGSLN
jgi:hypothetical protein